MPSASIKKEISCSKENLINMVLDIEKYPEFVPWCLNSKIYSKKDEGDKVEIIDVKKGWAKVERTTTGWVSEQYLATVKAE